MSLAGGTGSGLRSPANHRRYPHCAVQSHPAETAKQQGQADVTPTLYRGTCVTKKGRAEWLREVRVAAIGFAANAITTASMCTGFTQEHRP